MIYCFDLDNTICFTEKNKYSDSTPNLDMIKRVNHLYDEGHTIKIYTARGMTSFNGDVSLVYSNLFLKTENQLKNWGLKFHQLILGKPSFDCFIDDKNITIEDFQKKILPKKGFIAGAFDVIHPGYIKMFKEAKEKCDYLIVGLHSDPSIERGKNRPLLSLDDRFEILSSIKFIDEIQVYHTELELQTLILKNQVDILLLGDDYIDKKHNGVILGVETHFIDRSHGWSTTKFKNIIKNG